MYDEIVKQGTAKLAKEKGWKRGSMFSYVDGMTDLVKGIFFENKDDAPFNQEAMSQSCLQRWLREVHKIYINISTYYNVPLDISSSGTAFSFSVNGRTYSLYNTYEEALELALIEGLKLI